MVGHCAVRHYAMGERGLDETPGDRRRHRARCATSSTRRWRAGALGFSTSRTLLHRVPDGRPVPGTWADERELLAIADVLGRHGHGVYEVAPRFERPGANYEGTRAEVHWMAEINRRTGRPVTFGLAQSNAGPELFRKILELVDEEADARRRAPPADDGARHRPALRPAAPHVLRPRAGVGRARSRFRSTSASPRCATTPAPGRARPGRRRRTRRRSTGSGVYVLTPDARRLLRRPGDLAGRARRSGTARRSPEAFVRISLETDGRALFNYPFLNQRMDAVEEMLDHPRMAIGLGDSGAHVGLIMDASLPTWFLLHWVRDRREVHDRGRDPPHDLRHRARCSASPTAACCARARSPTST